MERSHTEPVILNITNGQNMPQVVKINFPANAVQGSQRITVSLAGNNDCVLTFNYTSTKSLQTRRCLRSLNISWLVVVTFGLQSWSLSGIY